MGNIDRKLAEDGIKEIIKIKENEITEYLERGDKCLTKIAFDEYQNARIVAKSIGVNPYVYDKQFWDIYEKLEKLGVKLK